MRLFGAGRPAGGDPTTSPRTGRTVPGRQLPVTVHVPLPERFGTAMMASLGLAQDTRSPMSDGNGGEVSMNIGAGVVGRDSRRTGPLQDWRGLHHPMARPRSVNVGIQAGPSSQPAFPSTGVTTTPTIYNSLSLMGLPQVLTNPAV